MKRSVQHCSDLIAKSLSGIKRFASEEGKLVNARLDDHQIAIFELAVAHSQVKTAEHFLTFAADRGVYEKSLANTFAADICVDVASRLKRTAPDFGLSNSDFAEEAAVLEQAQPFLTRESLTSLGAEVAAKGELGDRGLGEEHRMMADTFRQFATDIVEPLAEDVHRFDQIIPDPILNGLRDLGCFGLSVPEQKSCLVLLSAQQEV
jgi:(2S)-methylsuccinyl-CoA dehydrogenase